MDKQIAILGSGRVARAILSRLYSCHPSMLVGSREPAQARSKLEEKLGAKFEKVECTTYAEAVARGAIVFYALPWNVAPEILPTLGPWNEKTLVDCTNPINRSFTGLDLGHTTSAAEQIAQWASGANVVKALNTASVDTMLNPNFDGKPATMFYCGDSADAKADVAILLQQFGFAPMDCGDLAIARYLEPTAMLYIHLAVKRGLGSGCALSILKRS